MEKRKLNYRFHNHNTAAATADYILKIFIEANNAKVESAIKKEMGINANAGNYEKCSG